MRIGLRLPSPGEGPLGVGDFARAAELAGFDSLWVSDHVVMPGAIDSDYPFSRDRTAPWLADLEWYDAIVLLSFAAAVTSRVRLGTAVLVAPLRHPVVLAKQYASLDRLSAGRAVLGVGAGWLAEEFAALGVPFRNRGARTDEWIDAVRAVWTGHPPELSGPAYPLPAGSITLPRPAGRIPVIVGGTSSAARLRAAERGDGWMAHESLAELDPGDLRAQLAELDDALSSRARPRAGFDVVLRLVGSADLVTDRIELVPELAALGIDELVLDPPSGGAGALQRAGAILRSGRAAAPLPVKGRP